MLVKILKNLRRIFLLRHLPPSSPLFGGKYKQNFKLDQKITKKSSYVFFLFSHIFFSQRRKVNVKFERNSKKSLEKICKKLAKKFISNQVATPSPLTFQSLKNTKQSLANEMKNTLKKKKIFFQKV